MVINLEKKLTKHRRILHQIPELGFNEVQTSKYVFETLQRFGFEIERVAKTGLVAFRQGDEPTCIAFRADMDALDIVEQTGLDFAATNGKMHACGHDGHMAILLGFAEYLSRMNTLKKSVLLIFQPAEEGPGGAKPIIEAGILQQYHVESIFGLHIFPDIEQGKIGICPGVLTAQTCEFDVYIRGKSGHGAQPHTANDALIIAAQLIMSYQTIVSRNIQPLDSSVLTIGKIQGGEVRNVICGSVALEGTMRTFNQTAYELMQKRILEINIGLEQMFQAEITTVFRDLYPCVMNDTTLVERIKAKLDESIYIEMKPLMIAEDFAYYQQVVPGVFLLLGSGNKEKKYTYPLHSSQFNFDDTVLTQGVNLYCTIAEMLGVYEEVGERR
ncbi:MAG: M20 metallopeptidase family protein [Culicoidibacterales bacterium]